MKKTYIVLLAILITGCSQSIPNKCPEIVYENSLTYFDGSLYTGRCAVYSGDTLISIQQYSSGKDHGNWTFFFKDGSIETKAKFEFGDRNGKWKYYHENGKLKQLSIYKKGVRTGIWKKYNENGELIEKTDYQLDKNQESD